MLEPRRLAARRSAEFMAEALGEKCGQTIGYRIRTDTQISRQTRIEVVTEGILTRMLQSDAELPEAGLVIFDEYHERSIHADTGLAFMLDVQKNIRPDIKILIMSATLDIEKLAKLLDGPPVIESHGSAHPVETHYLKHPVDKRPEIKTAEAVLSALKKEDGDILVFLPGKKEIRRTGDLLSDRLRDGSVIICELYGEAPREQQDAALQPAAGQKRKVILATSIAETSLTIDGVRVVIDSGLSRMSDFDVRRGMPGLVTVPVSKASADQRRGRAGRQQPGACYRLWTKEEDTTHPAHTQPEILTTDLAHFALELAQWGTPEAEGLIFPDPPPPAHLQQARNILFMLGATDSTGKLTRFGKRMYGLPVHPRFSAMILHAMDKGFGAEACLVAALLEERDRALNNTDLADRLHALTNPIGSKEKILSTRVFNQARRLQKIIHAAENSVDMEHAGLLLALAYPERTAKRKSGNQYQLAQGTMVSVPEGSNLLREEFLAVGEVDGAGAVAKAFLAAAISKDEIMDIFKEILKSEETVEWIEGAVRGRKRTRLGAISIQEKEFLPTEEQAEECIVEMLNSAGISMLPWDKESLNLRQRSEWLRLNVLSKSDPEHAAWPVLSDENLQLTLKDWLLPFLSGVRSKKDIGSLDMISIIRSLFTYEQLNQLETLAPQSIKVPGGSTVRLRYDEGEKPVLAVKLQELFGQTDTPRTGGGRIPVLIHLLSPAMRPLAITQDLRSFWMNTYPGILKQMRIKYPKHVWPDDPINALPTNKTRRRT